AEDEGEIEAGITFVDSNFSPIRRVRYNTDNARVGQRTDYDRLVLEVWTDGSITPEMALVEAGKILRKHLNPFVQYFELGDQLASDDAVQGLQQAQTTTTVDPDLEGKLNMTVQELDLSVRANNCLESARINTVRELVEKKESELLKVRSFGKTSLREVKRRLADMGLSLGMDLEAIQNGTASVPGVVGDLGAGPMDGFTMPDDDAVDAPAGEPTEFPGEHSGEAAPEEAAADQ
ncbi:MAG: DNA-directed RNA polymerase subunit alpha C-terminal domain-containing protein, partial [Planctomycetota bacterium]